MRKLLLVALFVLWTSIALYADSLKIYHIGVGSGDCSLIIASKDKDGGKKQTICVLLDSGPGLNNFHIKINPTDLWREIALILTANGNIGIDYFVISHFHEDHFGSAAGLLRQIGADQYRRWNRNMRVIDRRSYYRAGTPYQYWRVANTRTYRSYRRMFWAPNQFRRVRLRIGDDLFGYPFYRGSAALGTSLHMWCVAGNGIIGRHNVVVTAQPGNENVLCYAFVVEFEGFHYYTGGDLDGETIRNYVDIETRLADTIVSKWTANSFHICCFKVNHHGSSHSSNTHFLQTLNPTVGVIPAALRQYGNRRLPREVAINRITAQTTPACHLYYTFVPQGVVPANGVNADNYPGNSRKYSRGKLDKFQDVVISLDNAPGRPAVGTPLRFTVTRYQRSIPDLRIINNTTVTGTEQCTKAHNGAMIGNFND